MTPSIGRRKRAKCISLGDLEDAIRIRLSLDICIRRDSDSRMAASAIAAIADRGARGSLGLTNSELHDLATFIDEHLEKYYDEDGRRLSLRDLYSNSDEDSAIEYISEDLAVVAYRWLEQRCK